ncbi:MAG: hypothetical protein ONB31_13595 [candidate division KSB1 bacterium]|nr:hypothetical protein [candidate division KSB1 bacterium]MDZ7402408.1 hypothetical protein [candidate division KSB1 bacterium]
MFSIMLRVTDGGVIFPITQSSFLILNGGTFLNAKAINNLAEIISAAVAYVFLLMRSAQMTV